MGKKSRRNKPNRSEGAAAAAAPATACSNSNNLGAGGDCRGSKSKRNNNSSSRRGTPFAATTHAEIKAITTPHVKSSAEKDPFQAPNGATCWICLEGPEDDNHEPLRRDCACRGEAGFAHLTCLVAMCESSSEDIWTGKKTAAPDTDNLAFGRAWESCANCKQTYAGQLREDIAFEFARSTEGMMGGLRSFRHITAKSWVTKSMMDIRGISDASDVKVHVLEFDGLLDVIKSCYGAYEDTSSHPSMVGLMSFFRAHVTQTEAEANYNYAVCLGERLRYLERNESAVTNEKKELYIKWDRLMNSAIQNHKDLKATALYTSPPTRQELERCEMLIMNQYSQIKKEFSHFIEGSDANNNVAKDEKEMLEQSEKMFKTNIKAKGEASTEGIRSALQYAQQMSATSHSFKPYAIIDLLMKTLKTATRALGPNHVLTQSTRENLERCLTYNRKGAYEMDPDQNYYPIDSYEEDVDVYIFNVKNWKGKEHQHGSTIAWDPALVILKTGALVRCVNLGRAAHLNEKRGWVYDYDGKHRRHLVHFEDEGIKPCLVRGDNLRLVFFGKEYEPMSEECENMAESAVDALKGASLGANDDDSEDDIPDLC